MKANSEKLNMGKRFIPREALNRLGAIFLEGIPKYGQDNWKKGVFDDDYQEERLEHALEHLYKWLEGDRTEDHLAKVMWFCATQMELMRLEEVALANYPPNTTISDSLTPTNSITRPKDEPATASEAPLDQTKLSQEPKEENTLRKFLNSFKTKFSNDSQ